jgi:hypothetical protein
MASSSSVAPVKRTLILEPIKGRHSRKASRDTVDFKKGKASHKSLIPKSFDVIRESDTIQQESSIQYSPVEEPRTSNVLKATTPLRVERRLRNNIYITVKIYRRFIIPEATDIWLQGVRILEVLD